MSYGPLEVFGIELEYMLVDRESLNVKPIADKIFKKISGTETNEITGDGIDWSNELVRHVIELKNPDPQSDLVALAAAFPKEIKRLWKEAELENAFLLPTAMHPWMRPEHETQLWPFGQKEIYKIYDKVFKCSGHGWANVQSTHINISWGRDDGDFGRLHAALRLITPLIPIIAASSPFQEGRLGPYASTRLFHYFQNQKRIPSIIGPVIPEDVWTVEDYEKVILQPMYQEISPFDPEKILQHDWLNSRAVIAKFDHHRFEIRVMDNQECAKADLALSLFFIKLIRGLFEEKWISYKDQQKFKANLLRDILISAAKNGDATVIDSIEFLKVFGLRNPKTKGIELLRHLYTEVEWTPEETPLAQTCEAILKRGCLSSCMLKVLGEEPPREELRSFYLQLTKNLLYDQILE